MTTVSRYLVQVTARANNRAEDIGTAMNSLFSRDAQVRSMEQTVGHAEKYLGQTCSLLASYARQTAKLRDKADRLVALLCDFAGVEDPEFHLGIKNLSEDLAMVQDYRQAQVERLESRVVSPLKAYGDIVKTKRAELKRFSSDLNTELKEVQKLEKIRRKSPADRQSISQAEVSAQKASTEAQRSVRQLEQTITDFQRQRLEDVKRIFTDFITVEMLFHAKALEVFTHTYHNLEAMDIHKDLELFTGRIQMSDPLAGRLDSPQSSYSSPLHSRQPGYPLAPPTDHTLRSTLPPTPSQNHRAQRNTARRSGRSLHRQEEVEEEDDDEEDEEEEEEEEEEDVFESEIEEGPNTSRQSYSAQYAQMRRRQK